MLNCKGCLWLLSSSSSTGAARSAWPRRAGCSASAGRRATNGSTASRRGEGEESLFLTWAPASSSSHWPAPSAVEAVLERQGLVRSRKRRLHLVPGSSQFLPTAASSIRSRSRMRPRATCSPAPPCARRKAPRPASTGGPKAIHAAITVSLHCCARAGRSVAALRVVDLTLKIETALPRKRTSKGAAR